MTGDLEEGEHTLIVLSGDETDISEMSQAFTLNVVKDTGVKKPEPIAPKTVEEEKTVVAEGAQIETSKPKLTIAPPADHKIVITWQSTVYSQTLIADASGSNIDIQPPEDLEPGEHTVTYYSVDQETNTKSEPTQIAFEVSGTTAFATGDIEDNSILGIVLGSVGLLVFLMAFALFFRKRKPENA